MQMIELTQNDISVYLCHFHLHILSANISIKFPCHYFAEWKSINGKILSTSQKHPSSSSAEIELNELLQLKTQMLYDNSKQLFHKKDTLLAINLVSKSRPDQVKLVGRVNIDLAQIANSSISMYSQFAPYKLTYCSVNADVTFRVKMSLKELTNKNPNNLDKSSFNDFFVFSTGANSVPSSQEFSSKVSNKLSTNNLPSAKSTAFNVRQSQQVHNQQSQKIISNKPQKIQSQKSQQAIQNEQTQLLIKNNSTSQISKKDDTSFRTVAQRRQSHFKNISNHQSIDHQQNLFTLRDNNHFSYQIDLNKKKIADLEKKIGDLCKNLEGSKGKTQKRNDDAREKQELIQKLSERQEKIREQFEQLKRLKASSSTQQLLFQSDDQQQFPSLKHQSSFSQLYQQKISQALQTQRILQQNQYIIKQLQLNRSQLEKKLLSQKNQTDQLQLIWKEKKEHYQEKISSLQKEKKEVQYEVQKLAKYKFIVEEVTEQKNRIKLQYTQLQHQLMKARFELNDKIQKNAQTFLKLQDKDQELQKSLQQIKSLTHQKINFQKQLAQLLISNEKIRYQNSLKQQQIAKLENRLEQDEKLISQLKSEFLQVKQLKQEKITMEQKLLQHTSHISTLQTTIKNLQNQLQSCLFITKINDNLKCQLSRLQQRLTETAQQVHKRQQTIEQKQNQITQLTNQLNLVTEEKHILLQKNSSFSEQLKNIEALLQESFHKASKETQLQIDRLKEQLKVSSQEYEQVVRDKAQLQEQIQSIVQQKQQTISLLQKSITGFQLQIQSLQQSLTDKQNIITLKDIQLQNRKSITQQLTIKLQRTQYKQQQMQQTIAILQTESKKIFDIIEEKERTDQELIQLRISTEEHLEIIRELEDIIVELKIQKEEVVRRYYQQVEKREFANSERFNNEQGEEDYSLVKKKLQEAEGQLQQMSTKLYQLSQQLNAKQRYINSLQTKNDSLLKKLIYLEAIAQTKLPKSQQYEQQQYQKNSHNTEHLTQSKAIKQKEMQLRLQQQKNMQKFVNQISQLTQKVIELEQLLYEKNQSKILIYHDGFQTKRLSNAEHDELRLNNIDQKINCNQHKHDIKYHNYQDEKSHQATPIKHKLNDQLIQQQQSPLSNNYTNSQRKKPPSNNSSHDSHISLQLIHSQNPNQNHQSNNHKQKESPELKISQLSSLIEVKNLIIKDLENKCADLTAVIREKEKQLNEIEITLKNNNEQVAFTGRIKPNSPRKHLTYDNSHYQSTAQQNHISPTKKSRSRSLSPSYKIAKNNSFSEKEFIRMKNTIQTQDKQLNRLKKNLRLMNLELSTLRNLKKEKIIESTQVRINNKSDIHLNRSQISHSQSLNNPSQNNSQSRNIMMETQYFNLTNAINPDEKSYIIKKTLNNSNNEEQQSLCDMRTSPKKQSLYGRIINRRQSLQKKFNVASRIIDANKVFLGANSQVLSIKQKQIEQNVQTYLNTNNTINLQLIQQRIIQKLQNTAHFSSLNHQDNHQFTTTITDLTQKVHDLNQALIVLEEEKVFLENQLQTFEEEKFCLFSDLNAREIQIYQLYKSIIALREQVRQLTYQNESYLKLIQKHQLNVNSVVRRAEQKTSKLRNEQKATSKQQQQKERQKLSNMSVSNIEFNNQTQHHLRSDQNQYTSIMRQQQQQREKERYSLIEKIQKYQHKMEQSLLSEKQKLILEEQIHSREEILIDQNQKIYQQQTIIVELNSRINHLQQELSNLHQQLMMNNCNYNNSNTNTLHIQFPSQNHSLLHYQNQSLIKQNLTLKQQTQYLSTQIDRINNQFTKLNTLLYQRQQDITKLMWQLGKCQNQYLAKEENYQRTIVFLENSLYEMRQKVDYQHNNNNAISLPNVSLLSFLSHRITQLNQQYQNLRVNLNSILQLNSSNQPIVFNSHSDHKQLIITLLDSMQNTILTTFNILAEVNSQFDHDTGHNHEIELIQQYQSQQNEPNQG